MNDYKHIEPGHNARRQYRNTVRAEVLALVLAFVVMILCIALILQFADAIDAWTGVL